jgi:hypothetical protein
MTVKSFWLNLNEYELFHAAYLWNGQEPKGLDCFLKEHDQVIKATYGMLKGAVQCSKIKISESNYTSVMMGDYTDLSTVITRASLKAFAETTAFRPDFLFKPEQVQEQQTEAGPVDAKEARKAGAIKAQLLAKDRSIQAGVLVSKIITENALLPGMVTKNKVQEILGDNGFGFGHSSLFQDVWKSISHSEKNSGGRPPSS